jgi:hypothetical protein
MPVAWVLSLLKAGEIAEFSISRPKGCRDDRLGAQPLTC